MNAPSMLDVKISLEPGYDRSWGVPGYANPGDAGFDLRAAIDAPIVIRPEEKHLVPTGIRIAVPMGYELQVRPRSGLALKHGLTIINSPGTVDSGYRGPLAALLYRLRIAGDDSELVVKPGDRIAQGVIAPVWQARFEIVDGLDETTRGGGGFGSTGKG